MQVGSIGLGNMSGAILRGAIDNGFARPEDISGYDIDADKLRAFAGDTGIKALASNAEVVAQSDVVLLAVKPNDFPAMLASVSDGILQKKPLLLSIATGTSLASIRGWIGDAAGEVPVVRIIPNVNMQVGAGLAGYCPNEAVSVPQAAWTESFLSSLGLAIRIEETAFSVFQAVGCASPAWTCLFIQGLALGGVKKGLSRRQATLAAAQSVMGSAALVLRSGQHPMALVDTVCSPGGTTIAGLATLEEAGLSGLLMRAVENRYNRDLEILAKG
jgi:pyrroline-5-carboxylate reductase